VRSARQHKVDLALAEALAAAGSYLLPDSILKADAARLVVPRPSESELLDCIAHHDRSGHLTSVAGATEQKRKLNDAGRAWLQEEGL
jgi:hypothetical protein